MDKELVAEWFKLADAALAEKTMSDWHDVLHRGIAELGLSADERAKERLTVYIRELLKWNGFFGLVGKGSAEEGIVIRHILDSLAGLPVIERLLRDGAAAEAVKLADIGSGAGLPGIPLAVFLGGVPFTLVEPSPRRCAFLRSALALLGLGSVNVFEGELALVRDTYSLVTCRAFRPMDKKTLKQLFAVVCAGGVVAAYKGKAEKTEAEIAASRELGLDASSEPLKVPFLNEERRLLIIRRKDG